MQYRRVTLNNEDNREDATTKGGQKEINQGEKQKVWHRKLWRHTYAVAYVAECRTCDTLLFQAVGLHLPIQSTSIDAEQTGCLGLIAVGLGNDTKDMSFLILRRD